MYDPKEFTTDVYFTSCHNSEGRFVPAIVIGTCPLVALELPLSAVPFPLDKYCPSDVLCFAPCSNGKYS